MTTPPSRILVVDDELGMRESCRRLLVSEGYEVETAEDGYAALETFKAKGNFAAALVDLKMPRMGGLELIDRLHRLDEDLVLLVITAFATIDTAVEAAKRGAYGYVPKPFTPDELLLPVKNGLEKRALSMEAKRLREERERRLLELAFERSKSNTIIDCMTDGVLVINREKQIVLRNAAAARSIQESANLSMPAPLASLNDPELRNLVTEALDVTSGPVIVSKEIASFGDRTYMVNASPVIEPSGEKLGAVVVLRDITEFKKLETAKSMFVSMVAHEIKTPLAAIEGYLEIILNGLTQDNPKKEGGMMQKALDRARTLRQMVSELMGLRAIETGNFTLTRAPLEIGRVLTEAVQAYQEKAEGKAIRLVAHCEESSRHSQVLADGDAIRSVFTNLIDNAVKYTPDKGHVDVSLVTNGAYVKIMVRDNGIGMTSEDMERVFDEFFRARNEYTARVPGTGLGLGLVKRLVELHQGKVTVQSVSGQGSEFTVYLPVTERR